MTGFPIDRGARSPERVRRVFQVLDAGSGSALYPGQGLSFDESDQSFNINAGDGLSISSNVNDRALDLNAGFGTTIDTDWFRLKFRNETAIGTGDTQIIAGSGLLADPSGTRVLIDESRGMRWYDQIYTGVVPVPNATFGIKLTPNGGCTFGPGGGIQASGGGPQVTNIVPQWEVVRINLQEVGAAAGANTAHAVVIMSDRSLWFVHAVRIKNVSACTWIGSNANRPMVSIGPAKAGPLPFNDATVGYYTQVRDYRGFVDQAQLLSMSPERHFLCNTPRMWVRNSVGNPSSVPLGDAELPASGAEGNTGIPWGNGNAGGFNLDQTHNSVVAYFTAGSRLDNMTGGVIDIAILISNPGA